MMLSKGLAALPRRGEFKMEVVERTRVPIAGLPGEPVGQDEVPGRLGLGIGAGDALVGQVRIQTCAEPQAPEDGRIMARKHGLEPVAEGKAIETHGWRNHCRAQLAPEPGFARHRPRAPGWPSGRAPPRRSSRQCRWRSCHCRRVRGLPGRFPEKAARVVIEERLPVIEARRPGESMVYGSLIRMVELVHGEGVRVDPPAPVDDVVPEG